MHIAMSADGATAACEQPSSSARRRLRTRANIASPDAGARDKPGLRQLWRNCDKPVGLLLTTAIDMVKLTLYLILGS